MKLGSALGIAVLAVAFVACSSDGTTVRKTNNSRGGSGGSYTNDDPDDAEMLAAAGTGPFCSKDRIIDLPRDVSSSKASLDEMRKFSVEALNHIRAMTNLEPLVLDDCLNKIAQTATEEMVATGQAHGYFKENCLNRENDFGRSCECGWAQENQGGAGGSNRNWKDNIHVPLCAMMEEPPGMGHRGNIQNPRWKRVGVGVVDKGGMLQWSHEFGR